MLKDMRLLQQVAGAAAAIYQMLVAQMWSIRQARDAVALEASM